MEGAQPSPTCRKGNKGSWPSNVMLNGGRTDNHSTSLGPSTIDGGILEFGQ